MIKLIVSDVDGTLVPDGSPDLDPEVFDIILKLREKGMQFVVASGRPWASVESAFEPVKKKISMLPTMGRTWDAMADACTPIRWSVSWPTASYAKYVCIRNWRWSMPA